MSAFDPKRTFMFRQLAQRAISRCKAAHHNSKSPHPKEAAMQSVDLFFARAAARKLLTGCALLAFAGLAAHAQQTTGTPGSPSATTTIDGNYLPPAPPGFRGEIGLDAAQSKPYWPPNVV